MIENELTRLIIQKAIFVHSNLVPGLLESAYQESLLYCLLEEKLFVEKQKPIPLIFGNVKLDCGYRIDLLVERRIVVEIKSVEALKDIHLAQILTYLKLGNFNVGLLINFNVPTLKQGLRRVVNNF